MWAEGIATGRKQLIGYLLNDPETGYARRFLDRRASLCSIYPLRPLVCRIFKCGDDGVRQSEEVRGSRQPRFP
ncbi:MAG: YkgJ family cysteine cluster protein [Pirellulaceae bacterium]